MIASPEGTDNVPFHRIIVTDPLRHSCKLSMFFSRTRRPGGIHTSSAKDADAVLRDGYYVGPGVRIEMRKFVVAV